MGSDEMLGVSPHPETCAGIAAFAVSAYRGLQLSASGTRSARSRLIAAVAILKLR